MSLTRSEANFPWAPTPGWRSGPVASRWSFPEPASGGNREAERLPKVFPSSARSVASASSEAWMARVVPRPPPVDAQTGQHGLQLADVERPPVGGGVQLHRSDVGLAHPARRDREVDRAGERLEGLSAAAHVRGEREVARRTVGQQLGEVHVAQLEVALRSTVAALHVPAGLERELGRPGATPEVGPGQVALQPAVARELHRDARGSTPA